MNDFDSLARYHATVVRDAVGNVVPPDVDSLMGSAPRPKGPRLYMVAAMAIGLVIVVIGVLVVVEVGRGAPASAPTSPPVSTSATTSTSNPPGVSGLFDVSAFLQSKLNGAFGDSSGEIGVVALVPVESEQALQVRVESGNFVELLGVHYVPAHEIAPAAAAFAASRGSEPLEGSWIGVGLVPQYADSPLQDWIERLGGIAGVRIAIVAFESPSRQIPEGWDQLATLLPFGLRAAIVEVVGNDIVAIEGTTTRVIHPDGTWTEASPSPVEVTETAFNNPPVLLPADDSLVVAAAGVDQAWVLDLESLTWSSTGPPPTQGFPATSDRYPLGSAVIDGELVLVTRARSNETTTTVAALDLTTLEWRLLESVPKAITIGGVTHDDNRLIVAGTTQDFSNVIIGERAPAVFEYTESSGWHQLLSPPIHGQASTVTWVEGAGLLAWNYDLESAILDDSGSWVSLGPVPMRAQECLPLSVAVPSGAVGYCGGLAWLDASTLEWTAIPDIPSVIGRYATLPTRIINLLDTARESTTILVLDLPPSEGNG